MVEPSRPSRSSKPSTRQAIIAASLGFIGFGSYSLYRIRNLEKSPRKTLMMIFIGVPMSFGASQIVNELLRYQSQSRKESEVNVEVVQN